MSQASLFAESPPPAEENAGVQAAIADFTPAVIEIRALSAQAFELKEGSSDRGAVEDQIRSLTADIASRAVRVDLTLDELLQLINADLATRRTDTKAPHGSFLRALVDENTAAYGDRGQVEREIAKLEKNRDRAIGRCVAADRACAGFVAGWALRGKAA